MKYSLRDREEGWIGGIRIKQGQFCMNDCCLCVHEHECAYVLFLTDLCEQSVSVIMFDPKAQ